MENFDKILNKRTEYVNEIIHQFAPKEIGLQKIIMEAMNYSLLAGGKRLRPLIMFETYKMFGGDQEEIKSFMAAMEMIHTYSLIHDDLPAMDNDDYRRGRKTNHVVYGENIGILAGDALLNYAFEVMSKEALCNFDSKKCVRAIHVLATKAGIYGMIGGQTIDVTTEGTKIGMDVVLEIHRLKTAALIEASMMVGAILAGAKDEEIEKVEKIANCVGLAFQIQDDILDVTGTAEMLGKPVLSDEKNDKTTYISIVGLEQARTDVEKYSDKALDMLDSFHKDSAFLNELFKKLIHRVR